MENIMPDDYMDKILSICNQNRETSKKEQTEMRNEEIQKKPPLNIIAGKEGTADLKKLKAEQARMENHMVIQAKLDDPIKKKIWSHEGWEEQQARYKTNDGLKLYAKRTGPAPHKTLAQEIMEKRMTQAFFADLEETKDEQKTKAKLDTYREPEKVEIDQKYEKLVEKQEAYEHAVEWSEVEEELRAKARIARLKSIAGGSEGSKEAENADD